MVTRSASSSANRKSSAATAISTERKLLGGFTSKLCWELETEVRTWLLNSATMAKTKAMSRKTRRAGESFISKPQKSAVAVFRNRRPRLSLRRASQSISRV